MLAATLLVTALIGALLALAVLAIFVAVRIVRGTDGALSLVTAFLTFTGVLVALFAAAWPTMQPALSHGRAGPPNPIGTVEPTAAPQRGQGDNAPASGRTTKSSSPTRQAAAPPKKQAAPTTVPIPISDVCRWAFAEATGQWTGDTQSIECLDANGKSIGDFTDGTGHSLNDWCSDPDHTAGNSRLIQARAIDESPESWACTVP